MTSVLKGYRVDVKSGRIVKKSSTKSVSQRIRERKSKRQKVVSPAKAQAHGYHQPDT